MFISPLTLLIVPLLGSLLILTYSNGISSTLNFSLKPQKIVTFQEVGNLSEKVENNLSLSSRTLINKSHLTIKSIALITSFINLIISLIM
jgi:hypothetical protein